MITTQDRIIISEGPCEVHGVAHTCAHHRDFPENWTQGETSAIAARYLLNLFERDFDSVSDSRHRETIERAMADIRDFLSELDQEQQRSAGTS